MSDALEYPRLVYRPDPRGEPVWDLGNFAILTVEDDEAHAAAVADGWLLSPDAKPAEPTPVEAKKDAKPAKVADEPVAEEGA